MKVCVIGAGSGGRAFAAYLTAKGCQVHLYNRSYSRIEYIKRRGGIEATGELNGFFPLAKITQNLQSAVEDVDVIMVCIPASGHKEIARQLAPHLLKGQIIVLNPGRTFGAIEFKREIENRRAYLNIFVAEAQTLLLTSRALSKNGVNLLKIKHSVKFCAFPETYNSYIENALEEVCPQFCAVDNYLELTLNNIGMLLHPTITLLNSGAIDAGRAFKYYKEGATKRVCKILESIQFEINEILMKIGIKRFDFCRWANEVYGTHGNTIYETIQQIEVYKDIVAPCELKTRYFTEDVPTGLVPLASLGKFLNIETPTIDSIIHLSGILCGIDFWKVGRNVESLNILVSSKYDFVSQEVLEKTYKKETSLL
ncbi:MAG: NAD/NADP octopine/nopaline dehydrogenase [Promethearchaeota archaeon]|nr:MAG: NAD/NADP octopine/nopaline dehydrogenase [Candidatus Lokiarchaeota archaeon]